CESHARPLPLRDQSHFDRRAPRPDAAFLGLPTPGEHDAVGRVEFHVLPPSDVATVDVDPEASLWPWVELGGPAHPLDHLVGVGEEVEYRLRACVDLNLDRDGGLGFCAWHVCPSFAARARRPASAAGAALTR